MAGSTEGNLYGLYIGRENLPDAVLYASSASHYSVFKIAHMYRMAAVKVGASLWTPPHFHHDLQLLIHATALSVVEVYAAPMHMPHSATCPFGATIALHVNHAHIQ
jgi:hypothetical protein